MGKIQKLRDPPPEERKEYGKREEKRVLLSELRA